jgi:hypothetical protein
MTRENAPAATGRRRWLSMLAPIFGLMVPLQPQVFDASVFGPPGLGVRFPGGLVPSHVVSHQSRCPRQPQFRLSKSRLE